MTPRLVIRCSSLRGRQLLENLADEIVGRMEPELAAQLARKVIVLALDGMRHDGVAFGFGGPSDPTEELAIRRLATGAPAARDGLVVILLHLAAPHLPDQSGYGLARLLAHELGHVALGHCEPRGQAAAAQLTAEEVDEEERAADAFAARYVACGA